MENLMKQVANILGVELEERFKANTPYTSYIYFLDEGGCFSDDAYCGDNDEYLMLYYILIGRFGINKEDAKNHIKEVAELLGIELNQEFYINQKFIYPFSFFLTEKGLFNNCDEECESVLTKLLTGVYKIKEVRE